MCLLMAATRLLCRAKMPSRKVRWGLFSSHVTCLFSTLVLDFVRPEKGCLPSPASLRPHPPRKCLLINCTKALPWFEFSWKQTWRQIPERKVFFSGRWSQEALVGSREVRQGRDTDFPGVYQDNHHCAQSEPNTTGALWEHWRRFA